MFQTYTWIWGYSDILFLRSSEAFSSQMDDFWFLQTFLIGFWYYIWATRGHSELSQMMLRSYDTVLAQSAVCRLVFEQSGIPMYFSTRTFSSSFFSLHCSTKNELKGSSLHRFHVCDGKTSAHALRSHISYVTSCITF